MYAYGNFTYLISYLYFRRWAWCHVVWSTRYHIRLDHVVDLSAKSSWTVWHFAYLLLRLMFAMWIVFLHASEDLRAIECWNYQHHGCRTQKWRPGRRSDCLNRKIARPSSTCRSQNVALHLASLSLFTLSFVFYFIYVNKRWSIFVDIIGCPALFVLAQIVQRILAIVIFCKWFIFSKSVLIFWLREHVNETESYFVLLMGVSFLFQT